MNNLTPLEVAALVIFPSLAIIGVTGILAWYWLRCRQMEMAAFDTDEQAARVLGESLGKGLVDEAVVEQVLAAFSKMDSATKRMLVMSVAGLVAETSGDNWDTLAAKIPGVVRGYLANTRHEPTGSHAFFDPKRTDRP